jgi:hypothetical protein
VDARNLRFSGALWEFLELKAEVFGLSTQTTEHQNEMGNSGSVVGKQKRKRALSFLP